MNCLLFILFTIISILCFHYIYAHLYDKVKLYSQYEKGIHYNDDVSSE